MIPPLLRFGAFLPGIELFDMAAFGIGLNEAALMDPQQRFLLMAAAEACASVAFPDNADGPAKREMEVGRSRGDDIAGIPRSNWGVFVGISALDYSRVAARCGT